MRRKSYAIAAILTVLALVFSGCGNAAEAPTAAKQTTEAADFYYTGENGWDAQKDDMMKPAEMPAATNAAESAPLSADRKLIRTAWLELESKQYEESLAALLALVESAGGYVESQNEQGISYHAGGHYAARYAEITARIPAGMLEQTANRVGELCNLVSRSSDVSDVTEHYTDTEARLSGLRLQEERLLAILAKADTLTDVIELESRLADVRYQIESYETSLRNLDSRISYSTLHITLQEVVEYNLITNPPQTLGQRLADAWRDAWSIVKSSLSNALIWVVTWLPTLLLWAVVLGGAGYLVLRLVRRCRAGRRAAPAAKCEAVTEENDPADTI